MSLNVLFLASDMSCHLSGYYVHLRSGNQFFQEVDERGSQELFLSHLTGP